MMATTLIRPIFRIFDYTKAIEFYIDWLGFAVDWEDKQPDTPIYMQISLGNIVLHLSEHHGDCTPGSRILVENVEGLEAFHSALIAKQYRYMRPGLDPAPWNPERRSMEVIDPFGNRITFIGK